MKAFARRYRGYLWWLAGLAVFFAAYFSFRNSRTAMNWLCGRIVLPFEQAVGRLCGLTSVSVAEVLIYRVSISLSSIWRGSCGAC